MHKCPLDPEQTQTRQLNSHFHQLLKIAKEQLRLQYKLAEFEGGEKKHAVALFCCGNIRNESSK